MGRVQGLVSPLVQPLGARCSVVRARNLGGGGQPRQCERLRCRNWLQGALLVCLAAQCNAHPLRRRGFPKACGRARHRAGRGGGLGGWGAGAGRVQCAGPGVQSAGEGGAAAGAGVVGRVCCPIMLRRRGGNGEQRTARRHPRRLLTTPPSTCAPTKFRPARRQVFAAAPPAPRAPSPARRPRSNSSRWGAQRCRCGRGGHN